MPRRAGWGLLLKSLQVSQQAFRVFAVLRGVLPEAVVLKGRRGVCTYLYVALFGLMPSASILTTRPHALWKALLDSSSKSSQAIASKMLAGRWASTISLFDDRDGVAGGDVECCRQQQGKTWMFSANMGGGGSAGARDWGDSSDAYLGCLTIDRAPSPHPSEAWFLSRPLRTRNFYATNTAVNLNVLLYTIR